MGIKRITLYDIGELNILLNIINSECGIMMDRCAELSQAIVNKTGSRQCNFI